MSNLSINTENNIKITDKKCNFFLLKRKIKTKKNDLCMLAIVFHFLTAVVAKHLKFFF